MSSVTTMTVVRGLDQPSASVVGLQTRTLDVPGGRCSASRRWLRAAPTSVSSGRSLSSSTGTCR